MPSQVTSLKAKAIGKTAVSLTWKVVSGATSYSVYQYKSGKWVKISIVKPNALTVKSLKSKTSYKFKVVACKTYSGKNYYGAYSSIYTVKTK